jgi:hypothetical protein
MAHNQDFANWMVATGGCDPDGGHQFADWTCDACGQAMCWACAVRCTNDGTGDGPVNCPHCGADGGMFL